MSWTNFLVEKVGNPGLEIFKKIFCQQIDLYGECENSIRFSDKGGEINILDSEITIHNYHV